jgi:hypothetical protein
MIRATSATSDFKRAVDTAPDTPIARRLAKLDET